jgi:hypothetical protein
MTLPWHFSSSSNTTNIFWVLPSRTAKANVAVANPTDLKKFNQAYA